MSAKKEFLKQWAQSESLNKAPPSAKRSATRGGAGQTESAGPSAQAELAPPPALVPFADMDVWYLTTDMNWNIPGSATVLRVPRGFATDFATVPSWFWSWMPPIGRYGLPAIVHDWLYWDQQFPRERADGIFDAALDELGVSGWRRFVLYRSVRWFGGRYWRENATAKATGEGRVLKQYPGDARITWAEWRTRPGVFV